MDGGQGMVAVVRGLGDSQLAVTLLDSGKQYTLLPTSVLQPTNQQNERYSSTNTPYQHQYNQSQCHVAAQATDGQYATVYKTTHCKVRPTSPPIQLTEFPPQRAAVAPGEGNFEIGGTGSGDTSFNFLRANGTYRGAGMVWPDRGCVCSPRASREPDSFADSLRKYPAISPERSAEIVERLINYTQGKNFAKVMRQSSLSSPTRLSAEQNDRSPSRGSSRCKACDLEKTRCRFQGESPTKDKPRKIERQDSDGASRRTFTKSFDVRYMKDASRKIKDGMRTNPYMAQCPSIREAFEIMNNHSSNGGHSMAASGNVASAAPLMVNSQTQAAASTACKEVSTESRHKMFSRNVAETLSSPSEVNHPLEGAVFDPRPLHLQASVQTLVIPVPVTVRQSVQTTQSFIDFSSIKTTQNAKKCRSEIELSNKEVREEILGWLIDVLHSTYSKKLRADVIEKLKEKMKKVSNGFGGEEAKVTLKVEGVDDDCCKDNLENICDDLVKKVRIKNRYLTHIYRAEVVSYRAPEDLKKAIKDWLLELPMKTKDCCGKYVDEEQMLASFVKKLKKALFSPDYDTKKLRNEIIKILQDIPIDYGSTNQNIYLNRLANNLIKKLLNANGDFNKTKTTDSEVENKTTKKKFCPNENEIRDLVRDEMIDFLDKFDIKISLERLQDLETDILGRIMDFLYSRHSNNDERFVDDVTCALQGIGAFEHQALYFANVILDHLKEFLTKVERNERDQARRLHMMTVLNSAVNETTGNTKIISDKDKQNNLDGYIQKLTQQIDEWLAGLELEIPWSQDESFRQVVVNDLAEDIVDRHKYVQLNRNDTGTQKDELEYLKYLIFKWINKLVGEEHQETIEHAPELLERISSVPVPLLTKCNVNFNSNRIPEFSKTLNQTTILGPGPVIGYSASKNFQAFPVPVAGPSRIENPTASTTTDAPPPNMGQFLEGIRVPTAPAIKNMQTLQHLNRVFDVFVRAWVQAIPIPAYTPEEAALAETMRVGLYNGIFQIVTKLRFQPQLLFNPFYYQDALGEELEELLSLLPQTPEFLKHKNQIKALMIEKTTELNELIKIISSPDTFKERVVPKYRDYVPRLSTNLKKECPLRLYEELQILNIAEDFLLFTKYKEEDPLKAYMYRQKLIERIKELITEMKRVHSTDLKNINPEMYMNEVMETLQRVPLPSKEEMREEAEEILLGHAIEEWYMALPLAHNNNLFEQLKRRHLRNALTKKIQNMEKSLIASGNTPEYELRHEISRFLEQIPLGKDETGNINYMVDVLVDKVKDIVVPNPQVQALYSTSTNYSDFGENAALHSTTVQVPEGYRLVGPLPQCCAAGLDKILAQPGPSGHQGQTTGASSAGQNLTPSGLTELERRASMIGGGPPLAAQSFGQQSSGGLRQSLSPAEAKRQSMSITPSLIQTSQTAQEQQNTNDLVSAAGGINTDDENTQRRTSLGAQADQANSHWRPNIGESGHLQNLQNSGSVSGQRRPSMGESQHKEKSQSIGEGGSIQILHLSGPASGHRKPNMDKLEYNTHSKGESGHSGSARGQRKPSMGTLGVNTQSESTQNSTKDLTNSDRSGQRPSNKNISENDIYSESTQKETSMKDSVKNTNRKRDTSRDKLGKDNESKSAQKEKSQTTHKQTSTKNSKYGDEQRQTSGEKLGYDKESQIKQKQTSSKDSEDGQRQTQNSHKEIFTKEQGGGQRQCLEQTIKCSTTLCKVSGPSASKSPCQTRLCYCNKASTEKKSSGENKKCFCGKSSKDKLIRLCSNTETMTETKTCLCKGNKICLCRKTIVSADIGGQTSSQAISNMDGHLTSDHSEYSVSGKPGQGRYFQQQDPGYMDRQSTFDHSGYSVSGKSGQGTYFQEPGNTGGRSTFDHTEYSVSGKPGQGRCFQQQRPGTDYDYDRQMTQESSTLTSDLSFAQTQGLHKQNNIQYNEPLDNRQGNRLVRGHVPGPTYRDAQDAQMASGALTGNGVGGVGVARNGPASTSLGEQDEREQNMRPSSLAQPGSRRLSHRVSIISPESQERLRLLSDTSMAPTDQQDSRGERNVIPENGLNDVGTYEGFQGGRPRSSSLRQKTFVDPARIEQGRGNLQPQGDNSMTSRRTSAIPLQQSSPIQNVDPRLVSPLPGGLNATTLNNIGTPQWITLPQSGTEAGNQLPHSVMEAGYQTATNPCVCPPYVSMLSPEQVSMLSPQRTGFNPSQMFAPAFSPGQMFDQTIPAGQSLPSMFFGPNGTLPDPSKFRQAPQWMSQLQQSSIGQPFQGGMSHLQQGSFGHPLQGGMSQLQQGSIGQPLQGGRSQLRQNSIGQPLQGRMAQLRQGGMSQPLQGRMSQPQQGGISQPLQGRISQSQRGNMSQLGQISVNQPLQSMRPPVSSQPLRGRVSQSQQGMIPPGSLQDSRYSRYIPSESPGAVGHDFPQDGRHTIQMSEEERSVLMRTIPPGYQTAQPDVERRISMPNRTQIFQDTLLESGQSGGVQIVPEERRTSIIDGNIQSTQEENAPARTTRASMQATFSENVQSRSRQDSRYGISPEQVGEIAQLHAAQDRINQSGGEVQKRDSQGRSLIATIEEDEQQNISVYSGTQRASWQIPQPGVNPLNVPQESVIQEMGRSDANMSQADRRASQGAANQSAGWLSFGQESAPQNLQGTIYQEIIQPDRRISQAGRTTSRSNVDEPIALNYPSISADQAPFEQVGPSSILQDIEQIPADPQGPSTMYPPEQQGYQNDMLMAGYMPGQPGQVIQDPRAYIQPVAFSTPQRPIPPGVPQRPVKRGKRRRPRRDDGSNDSELRGRNIDDGKQFESDSDSDHGLRIRCRCYERFRRFRRRNDMYEKECDIPCPYAHYYYSCY